LSTKAETFFIKNPLGASVIYLTTEREIKQEDFESGNKKPDIIEKKMWPQLLTHLKGMAD
jgi:hypothetical protein